MQDNYNLDVFKIQSDKKLSHNNLLILLQKGLLTNIKYTVLRCVKSTSYTVQETGKGIIYSICTGTYVQLCGHATIHYISMCYIIRLPQPIKSAVIPIPTASKQCGLECVY